MVSHILRYRGLYSDLPALRAGGVSKAPGIFDWDEHCSPILRCPSTGGCVRLKYCRHLGPIECFGAVCCHFPKHRERCFRGAAMLAEDLVMLTGRANPSSASCQPLAWHLVEEISHRVINEYGEAIAILSLASSSGEATLALRRAADRLRAMAEAHQSLLVPITEGYIDLGDHVGKLCHSLSRASLGERSIQLTVATDEIRLDAARCWPVGLIVSELVRNAARHGLGDSPGSIRVSLNRSGNSVCCVVCDDGCAAYHRPEERGRWLIHALTAEIGGSVQWKFTPRGSIVGVRFPLIAP